MKKSYFLFIPLIIFVFTIPAAYGQQLAPNDSNGRAMRAILALNYCHMSLVKILAYEDRVVLDEEYHNIINNIRLSAIEDQEIVTVLKQLLDTLTKFKLAEEQTERLVTIYNEQVANTFYAASSEGANNVIMAIGVKQVVDRLQKSSQNLVGNTLGGIQAGIPWGFPGVFVRGGSAFISTLVSGAEGGPIGVGIVTLYALSKVGGLYQHYRENTHNYQNTLDEKLWELDEHTIQTIHEMRKVLLEVYWILMKRYDIPEQWRLTEKQLENAIETFKVADAEKRYRQLHLVKEDFHMFPPFWYILARTTQELGKLEEALQLYQHIEDHRLEFFRKDEEFASALMDKVVLIQAVQETQPELFTKLHINSDISSDLARIVQHSSHDWRKNVFTALQYMNLGNYDAAKPLIVQNIDEEKETSLNSRILGEIYALSENQEELTLLIKKMYRDERMRYQDALYLIGQIREGAFLHKAMTSFMLPVLDGTDISIESSWIGDDKLKVSVPTIWLRDDPKNFVLNVHTVDNEHIFSSEEKFDIDTKTNTATFWVEGVFKKSDVLEQRTMMPIILEFVHPAQTVAFLVNMAVHDVIVDENLLDKSVETSKEVLDKTAEVVSVAKGFYKGWFSDEHDKENPETKTSPEHGQEHVKMEPRIVFDVQRIATSNACYERQGTQLMRFSQCSFN